MSTPSPSEPRPPEKLPALPSNDPAAADGDLAGAASDTLSGNGPSNLTAPPTFSGGSASREWSNLPELRESDFRRPPRRRLLLPLVLFLATCLSTLWVGAAGWRPQSYSINDIPSVIAAHWEKGLLYMGAVL